MGLVCDRGTKLVWEDDARRKGMQRRGPRKTSPNATPGSRSECIAPNKRLKSDNAVSDLGEVDSKYCPISDSHVGTALITQIRLPTLERLTTHEYFLLEHYIQRFSRIYPTFSGPTNPFLSILLPLATQHHAVMSAVLALSGAQFEAHHDTNIAKATLRARHRALEGCRYMLSCSASLMDPKNSSPGESSTDESNSNNILLILACCICLLLYEKLVGDGKANWMPHLAFLAVLFDRLESPGNYRILVSMQRGDQQRQAFEFIHHLFLYNDLLHSTAQRKSTLSKFYLRPAKSAELISNIPFVEGMIQAPPVQWNDDSTKYGRFYYPYLVAQISAGIETVSDACIDAWDGRLDWLPSFSLLGIRLSSNPAPSVKNIQIPDIDQRTNRMDVESYSLIKSLYMDTAKVYLRQCLRRRQGRQSLSQCGLKTVDLACHATSLISQLPDGSRFENVLLWPIGIVGPELTAAKGSEREYIIDRLRALEQRFQMKHFERVREVIIKGWNRSALLSSFNANFRSDDGYDDDVFLFG